MNSAFHQRQAEELIKQVNSGKHIFSVASTIALAQVHATLATIKDEE